MDGAPALKIENLWKSFSGNPVVKGLSLEIRPGEIFGLLGPNGAGKSTTINMVSGVTNIDQGTVSVFGHDNRAEFQKTRRMVGMMHQEIVVEPFFAIQDVLKRHAGYYGVKDDPAWRDILIDRLALRPHLTKKMMKLSGGMKRRFMVAKALIHKPKLLILDEPTAGVDVELRRSLWDFVREINEQGTTILLTTHYLEEAQEMCGRIAIMNHGEMIALDSTRNLMKTFEKKTMRIELAEKIDAIPGALVEHNARMVDEGTAIEFTVGPNEDTGKIFHRLYEQGLCIQDLDTHSATLEDVFLEITREKSEAAASA